MIQIKHHTDYQWPLGGFSLSDFADDLHFSEDQVHPEVDIQKPGLAKLLTHEGFDWQRDYRDIRFGHLAKWFTTDELCRIWWGDRIQSSISEMFRYNPRYFIFHKIKNSMWHFGPRNDYNLFVKFYRAIRSFDFGMPDFEVRLDGSVGNLHMSWNVCGCNHRDDDNNNFYIDAPLAYVIRYRGQPAMTVGFAVSSHGCLVNQIQLRRKKGNRWLYRMPGGYVEYVLERLLQAFQPHAIPVHLITGDSAATLVQEAYENSEVSHTFTDEKRKHIEKVYNVPFERLVRLTVQQYGKRMYHAVQSDLRGFRHQNPSSQKRGYQEVCRR